MIDGSDDDENGDDDKGGDLIKDTYYWYSVSISKYSPTNGCCNLAIKSSFLSIIEDRCSEICSNLWALVATKRKRISNWICILE